MNTRPYQIDDTITRTEQPHRRGRTDGDAATREASWKLAMLANCIGLVGVESPTDLRDGTLALLTLESERRRELGQRDVLGAVHRACGFVYDLWRRTNDYRVSSVSDLVALMLAEVVAFDDNPHGREAFWFASTARAFGASKDDIRGAVRGVTLRPTRVLVAHALRGIARLADGVAKLQTLGLWPADAPPVDSLATLAAAASYGVEGVEALRALSRAQGLLGTGGDRARLAELPWESRATAGGADEASPDGPSREAFERFSATLEWSGPPTPDNAFTMHNVVVPTLDDAP